MISQSQPPPQMRDGLTSPFLSATPRPPEPWEGSPSASALIGPALRLPTPLEAPELRARLHQTFLRYSLYKHGSSSATRWMAAHVLRLLVTLRYRIDATQSDRWLVVSPPYSTTASSATSLAMLIARALNVPHVALRSSRVPFSPRYTCLSARRDRLVARAQSLTPVPEVIYGKHVIIIDDALTTGATAAWMMKHLEAATSVHMCYALDLRGCDPAFESFLDSFVVHSRSWTALNRVLASSTNTLSRSVLRTFFWLHENVFLDLVANLSCRALERVHKVAVSAYGDNEYVQRVDALADAVRSKRCYLENLDGRGYDPAQPGAAADEPQARLAAERQSRCT